MGTLQSAAQHLAFRAEKVSYKNGISVFSGATVRGLHALDGLQVGFQEGFIVSVADPIEAPGW